MNIPCSAVPAILSVMYVEDLARLLAIMKRQVFMAIWALNTPYKVVSLN